MPKEITSSNDISSSFTSPTRSVGVIDFHAQWCGPCKILAPHFERLAKQYESSALFFKCDVDKVPDVAQKYGITAMPTVVFINSRGEKLDQIRGVDPSGLENTLKKLIGSTISGGLPSNKGYTLGGDSNSSQSRNAIGSQNLMPLLVLIGFLALLYYNSQP